VEIFQHGAPDLGPLEDADHQNAIALPPPKSHIKSYCINRFRVVFADKDYCKVLSKPQRMNYHKGFRVKPGEKIRLKAENKRLLPICLQALSPALKRCRMETNPQREDSQAEELNYELSKRIFGQAWEPSPAQGFRSVIRRQARR
jgi:hypothetical protein